MHYIKITLAETAGLGPAGTEIVGTEVVSDATSVTLWPDERNADVIRQHGFRPGPVRILRQHITAVRRHTTAAARTLYMIETGKWLDIERQALDGLPRTLVAAGAALAVQVREDWALAFPVTPEDAARLLREFLDEAGITAATALEEVAKWMQPLGGQGSSGPQRGMLCDVGGGPDPFSGTVTAVDADGAVKVVWPGKNTPDTYTSEQVGERGFRFRWPDESRLS